MIAHLIHTHGLWRGNSVNESNAWIIETICVLINWSAQQFIYSVFGWCCIFRRRKEITRRYYTHNTADDLATIFFGGQYIDCQEWILRILFHISIFGGGKMVKKSLKQSWSNQNKCKNISISNYHKVECICCATMRFAVVLWIFMKNKIYSLLMCASIVAWKTIRKKIKYILEI